MSETSWDVKVFQRHSVDDPGESCPTEIFFNQCPDSVARDLILIIDSVAEAPPPQFSGGGMWQSMHEDMHGFYEARTTGPDRRLYRLFCILDRNSPGLDRPCVVLITGMSKPVGSAFTEAEYASVRRLGEEYRRRSPRNLV